jgi:hypothetical protein
MSTLLLVVLAAFARAQTAESTTPEPVQPTEIAADLGACSALITVVGPDSRPVYNARISGRIRYGMWGAKKLDLEVFTSAGGQVKIAGLPETPKKPILFDITKGDKGATVEYGPGSDCRGKYRVQLK